VDQLTPKQWLVRLYSQIMLRNRRTEKFDDYYMGEFDMPWLPSQVEDEFKRTLKLTRANYMGLVIDSMVERMDLIGFRRGEGDCAMGDDELWSLWSANDMQTKHDQGLLEAAIHGAFYYLVTPNPKRPDRPKIFIEHPTQAIVEFEPGTDRRERAAGLKVWIDEWTGYVYATLYLPDAIYKFMAKDPAAVANTPTIGEAVNLPGERELSASMASWEERHVTGEEWPAPNDMGVVPLIESPNNPRLLTGGISELYDLTDSQDRIVKTIADRMLTQDYGAFPQKYASGWPSEDQTGTTNDPIEIGRKRIVTTDVIETKFGQWDSAPLSPYIEAIRQDVTDIASRSRTPPHYFRLDATGNGAALKASEGGLVSKVGQRIKGHSSPAVEAIRLAAIVAGLDVDEGTVIETMWKNPEFRTQAETTDSLIKMRQAADLPRRVVWELWGATPSDIERWEHLLEEERREAAELDPAAMLADQYRANADAQIQAPDARSNSQKKNGDPIPGGGKPEADEQKIITPNGMTK
jgi:hypothetical protein